MDKSERQEIRDRWEKATDGPWAWDNQGEKCDDIQVGIAMDSRDVQLEGAIADDKDIVYAECVAAEVSSAPNADFIAHSWSDIFRLLTDCEEMEKEIAVLKHYDDPGKKILTHRWLDSACIENGCQSRKLTALEQKLIEAHLATDRANYLVKHRADTMLALEQEINSAWHHIENAFEIEPRSYFEEKYKAGPDVNWTPLQMACHYIWKRNPKVTALEQENHDMLAKADAFVLEARTGEKLALERLQAGRVEWLAKITTLEQENAQIHELLAASVKRSLELAGKILVIELHAKKLLQRNIELEQENERLRHEQVAWTETAAQHCCNEQFYRELVVKIGENFGIEARRSDDGSVQQDVLCLKVPELVTKALDDSRRTHTYNSQHVKYIAELEQEIADLKARLK